MAPSSSGSTAKFGGGSPEQTRELEETTMEKVATTEDDFSLCPRFEKTFSILGKKWNGMIIEVLLHEKTQRFKDLAGHVEKCSDRVLCERLKELEAEGIVERQTYPGESRIEYSLTQRGYELAPVMAAVHAWSDKWCDAALDQERKIS